MINPLSFRSMSCRWFHSLASLLIAWTCLAGMEVRALGEDATLVAHWPLTENSNDAGPAKLHTQNHGVKFAENGGSSAAQKPNRGAIFDGRGARLEVAAHEALQLGKGDFSLSLWVHTDEVLDDDLGDLISWYDPERRSGFQLALRNNTGVTTTQAGQRQLQFGIDAGSTPTSRDEGRPGEAVLGFALTAHDGALYAGTADNKEQNPGRVYRYEGPNQWTDLGAPDKANAISALAAYQGKLYAAASKYRFKGSALLESPNENLGGRIYRYEGEQRWTEVGQLPETEAIGGLVVYNGRLYASSLYKPAGFFRFEQDGQWTALPVPDGKRVESLGVFNGYLWATSYDNGHVYQFDGQAWKDFGNLGQSTQTYSFATYQGRLCVGTWPDARVFQLEDDNSWSDLGRPEEELEVMGMLVHNGQFYVGTLPLAAVYRCDGKGAWTKVARLDHTPDVKYRRAWTMAQYRGRLFCSTLPSGHIHSLDAGPLVTSDRELPAGWRHVAAVKRGGTLQLYVDGQPVAKSEPFDLNSFDLTHDKPLFLGAGAGDYFNGRLRDVRLYRGALTDEQITKLSK